MTEISADYAGYAVAVAEALQPLAMRKVNYGTYHIAKVTFGFDGDDDAQITIVPDEFGGLALEVTE